MIITMVGGDARAIMDMDATIKGLLVKEKIVRNIFEVICQIQLNDDVFLFQKYW